MHRGFPSLRLRSLEAVRRRLRYSKRLLVNRRGDGVHSPFAFHFISKVVRNRRPFYCFTELAPRVEQEAEGRQPKRTRRICELLFRTAHELQAGHILHLGPSGGLLEAYLMQTGYTSSWQSSPSLDALPQDALPPLDLIILEDPSLLPQLSSQLARWLEASPRLTIACYTLDRSAHRRWEACQESLPARLQLDLLDLQLAFYDERLTPTSYKGVY